MSQSVRVLYLSSDTEMGLTRVQELSDGPVQEIHMDGSHLDVMGRIAKGEEALNLARQLETFLLETRAQS